VIARRSHAALIISNVILGSFVRVVLDESGTMYNAPERDLKGVTVEGIQFLTNDKGERVAVQIDLRKYGDLWEDVYDSLTARKGSAEPRESLDSVKERLIKQRKLNG
jgi:hypothetical protein